MRDISYWRHVEGDLSAWHMPSMGYLTQTTISLANLPKDVDQLVPFFPARGGSLDRIGVLHDGTGGAGETVRLALYEARSDTDLRPGPLVWEGSDLPTNDDDLNVTTEVVDVALDRMKLYWFAINSSEDNFTLGILTGDGTRTTPVFGVDPTISPFQTRWSIVRSRTYGNFPDPYPDLDPSLDFLSEASIYPIIRFSS